MYVTGEIQMNNLKRKIKARINHWDKFQGFSVYNNITNTAIKVSVISELNFILNDEKSVNDIY